MKNNLDQNAEHGWNILLYTTSNYLNFEQGTAWLDGQNEIIDYRNDYRSIWQKISISKFAS